MGHKKKPTQHDAIVAAYHTLRDEGLLPPISADDIAALEEEFGVYPPTKLDPAKAIQPIASLTEVPAVPCDSAIDESMGMAARGGEEIPPEIKERMKQDRSRARHERSKTGK
jgi:hypothetical protein